MCKGLLFIVAGVVVGLRSSGEAGAWNAAPAVQPQLHCLGMDQTKETEATRARPFSDGPLLSVDRSDGMSGPDLEGLGSSTMSAEWLQDAGTLMLCCESCNQNRAGLNQNDSGSRAPFKANRAKRKHLMGRYGRGGQSSGHKHQRH